MGALHHRVVELRARPGRARRGVARPSIRRCTSPGWSCSRTSTSEALGEAELRWICPCSRTCAGSCSSGTRRACCAHFEAIMPPTPSVATAAGTTTREAAPSEPSRPRSTQGGAQPMIQTTTSCAGPSRSRGRRSKRSPASTSTWHGGQTFGFLGPNGAGKTTTLRMLSTLLPPTSGEATVAGCDLPREPGQGALADRLRQPGGEQRLGGPRAHASWSSRDASTG